MGNSVIFQNAKIWRNDIKTDNGEFCSYTVGVSSKNQDGSWTNAYMPVRFAKSSEAPEKISNGSVADFEGFLSARKRKDGTTESILIVTKLNLQDQDDVAAVIDSFEMATEDIPFK